MMRPVLLLLFGRMTCVASTGRAGAICGWICGTNCGPDTGCGGCDGCGAICTFVCASGFCAGVGGMFIARPPPKPPIPGGADGWGSVAAMLLGGGPPNGVDVGMLPREGGLDG